MPLSVSEASDSDTAVSNPESGRVVAAAFALRLSTLHQYLQYIEHNLTAYLLLQIRQHRLTIVSEKLRLAT